MGKTVSLYLNKEEESRLVELCRSKNCSPSEVLKGSLQGVNVEASARPVEKRLVIVRDPPDPIVASVDRAIEEIIKPFRLGD